LLSTDIRSPRTRIGPTGSIQKIYAIQPKKNLTVEDSSQMTPLGKSAYVFLIKHLDSAVFFVL